MGRRNNTYTYIPVSTPRPRRRVPVPQGLIPLVLFVVAIWQFGLFGLIVMGTVLVVLYSPRCPRHRGLSCNCRNKVNAVEWRKQRKAQRRAERNYNPNHPYS